MCTWLRRGRRIPTDQEERRQDGLKKLQRHDTTGRWQGTMAPRPTLTARLNGSMDHSRPDRPHQPRRTGVAAAGRSMSVPTLLVAAQASVLEHREQRLRPCQFWASAAQLSLVLVLRLCAAAGHRRCAL